MTVPDVLRRWAKTDGARRAFWGDREPSPIHPPQWLACASPCQRFACGFTAARVWLWAV